MNDLFESSSPGKLPSMLQRTVKISAMAVAAEPNHKKRNKSTVGMPHFGWVEVMDGSGIGNP